METVKIVDGFKEISPIKIDGAYGYIKITNGLISLDHLVKEVMDSSLNFQYIGVLGSYIVELDMAIGEEWLVMVSKDVLLKSKLDSSTSWKNQTWILKGHSNTKVQLLTIVGHSDLDFCWKISREGELQTVFVNCFDVVSLDQLFNPFLVSFRQWWKKVSKDVLCE